MNIAIISINYCPELTGISVYTTGLAESLVAAGDLVDVYTAFPYYPQWRKSPAHHWLWYWAEDIKGVRVRRHYLYVPGRPSAVRRMIHELSFVFSATLGYLFGPKADVTVIVSPSLFLGIPLALLAKLKGSATLFHVQDLQPDAAVDTGMLRPGPVTDFFYWIERLTYRLCNRVSTISEGMRRRIGEKGVSREKIALLRNWANDDQVHVQPSNTRLRIEWGLDDKFVVLYSGNMGVKQGLGNLLACAEALRAERDIAFVIVGEGGEKDALVAKAKSSGMENVEFRPLQPMERLGELLATADVAVIPQKAGVADIVLPSKLANILASGRPVVAAAASGTELDHILRDGDCGRVVPQGDPVAMAAAILELRDDPLLRARLGANGRRYMEMHLGQAAVLAQFRSELLALVSGAAPSPQEAPSQ
jgi:colanic acid biosynthesis glycosyl transferase WcaI